MAGSVRGHTPAFEYEGRTFEMPGYSAGGGQYRFNGVTYPSLAAVRAAIGAFNQDEALRSARRAAEFQESSGAQWSTDQFGNTVYRSGAGGGSGSGGGGGGGGTGAGGGSGTGVDFNRALTSIPGNDVARVPGIGEGDISDALNTSYARAKENAGLEAAGSASSIRALMARRGLSGSKFAVGQEAKAIRGGQTMLGNYNRDVALQLAKRKANVADQTYAGGIQQRGQDIANNQARTGQALSLAALQMR